MKFFIGSSREASQSLDWLSQLIEGWHHEVWRWDDAGMFSPGITVLERLIEISQSVDAAIFVFSDDDKTWYRGEEIDQPRDNILIEYGMFTGRLGPRRAIICVKGRPRIATDIQGITCIDISDDNVHAGRAELVEWIKCVSIDYVYRLHLDSIKEGSSLQFVCQQAGKCYRDLDELNRRTSPTKASDFDHSLIYFIAGRIKNASRNANVADIEQGELAKRISEQMFRYFAENQRNEDCFKP